MLEYLACVVLRQCVPNDNLFRDLELGQALAQEQFAQVGQIGRSLIGRDDDGARPLPGALVGHADDRDLGDARMVDEHVLDFLGRDVLAVADDDVLGPAGDDQVTVVDPAAEITGPEVTLVIEGRGLVFGMQVADQHLRAARADLAVDQLDVGDAGPAVGVRRMFGVVAASRRS